MSATRRVRCGGCCVWCAASVKGQLVACAEIQLLVEIDGPVRYGSLSPWKLRSPLKLYTEPKVPTTYRLGQQLRRTVCRVCGWRSAQRLVPGGSFTKENCESIPTFLACWLWWAPVGAVVQYWSACTGDVIGPFSTEPGHHFCQRHQLVPGRRSGIANHLTLSGHTPTFVIRHHLAMPLAQGPPQKETHSDRSSHATTRFEKSPSPSRRAGCQHEVEINRSSFAQNECPSSTASNSWEPLAE